MLSKLAKFKIMTILIKLIKATLENKFGVIRENSRCKSPVIQKFYYILAYIKELAHVYQDTDIRIFIIHRLEKQT